MPSARDRAELVADDARVLRERLEAVTGERISALEGIGESARDAKNMEAGSKEGPGREAERSGSAAKERDAPVPQRGRDGPWIVRHALRPRTARLDRQILAAVPAGAIVEKPCLPRPRQG